MRPRPKHVFGALLAAASVAVSGCHLLFPPPPPPPPAVVRAELLETHWRSIEILGAPVVVPAGVREPHLVLARDQDRVHGYTGCNTMGGAFTRDGDALRFGKVAMTRRACAEADGNALESAFTTALDAVRSYRIVGDVLELRDAAGALVMRLQAR